MKKFRRHFRIYFKSNHPAYIVDEEENTYVFHRVTHSKTSGDRNNWKIKRNPIKGHNEPLYIVKPEKRGLKGRFSLFEIELKNGVDVFYPDIKKAGRTQIYRGDNRATISSSINIKSKHKKKGKQNG